MSYVTLFHDTFEKAHREYGVKIYSKDRKLTWLWKAIAGFLKFVTFGKMNRFMTDFTTVLGRTIYFPAGWRIEHVGPEDYVTLCHEIKHVKDQYELGMGCFVFGAILFALLYLFIPLPIFFAYFRYKFERDAYRVSWYTSLEVGLKPDLDFYIAQLTGPSYLWTWILKPQVKRWFREHCQMIESLPEESETP